MSSVFSTCDFFAGWVSGVCGLLIGHPFDTIKVWKQTMPKHSTTTKLVVAMYKYERLKGFYKGMMIPLLSSGILNAIFFGVYGNTMRLLQSFREVEFTTRYEKGKTYREWHWDVFTSGCAGGLASLLVSCPVELVKTQMQTQTSTRRTNTYLGPWSCVADHYQSNGIRGLYRGFVPLLWRDVAASGIYMSVYAHINERFDHKRFWSIMLAGAIAGLVSWISILPLDVIKSRIQSDSRTMPKYKNMGDCAIKSYRNEGIMVFFRGFWLIVFRSLPVNAVTFIGYELVITMCSKT